MLLSPTGYEPLPVPAYLLPTWTSTFHWCSAPLRTSAEYIPKTEQWKSSAEANWDKKTNWEEDCCAQQSWTVCVLHLTSHTSTKKEQPIHTSSLQGPYHNDKSHFSINNNCWKFITTDAVLFTFLYSLPVSSAAFLLADSLFSLLEI